MKITIPTLTLLVLTAGAAAGAVQAAKGGKAELRDPQGKVVGTAQLKVVNEGVQVSVQVTGIPAGTYAFHIHSVGKCEAPTFESAGPHFNPEGKKHGLMNPEGPHAGDLPNISVEADGKGSTEVVNSHFTLDSGYHPQHGLSQPLFHNISFVEHQASVAHPIHTACPHWATGASVINC